MTVCSLHNHTTYADGKDTAENMVRTAYEKGCDVFGISEHSPLPIDPAGGMKEGQEEAYIQTMKALKEAYAGKMEVYCGIEQECYSPMYVHEYDYVIGSVHYLPSGESYTAVDDTKEKFLALLNAQYHGDSRKLAEDYYRHVAELPQKFAYDIVGHFDLITKYNEDDCLFSTMDMAYRDAAMAALDALVRADRIFEINSGAISRGYRKTPYPQPWIIRELRARNARIILSADAHAKENILYQFDRMKDLVYACGYREVTVLREGKWIQEAV